MLLAKNTEKRTIFPYHKHSITLKNIQAENKRQRIFGVISAGELKISKCENVFGRRIKSMVTDDGIISEMQEDAAASIDQGIAKAEIEEKAKTGYGAPD